MDEEEEEEKEVEEKVKEKEVELEEGQSVDINKTESRLQGAQQAHLVDELRVVVAHAVQGGVTEGARQPGVPAQRGAAVGWEQAEVGPQDGLHEGQHLQLQGRNQGASWSVRGQQGHH